MTILPRFLLPASLVSTLFVLALPAGAQTLDTRPLVSGDRVLTSDRSGHWVANPDGERVALPLAARAAVGDFRQLGERWYAAAVEPADGVWTLAVVTGRDGVVDRLPAPAGDGSALVSEPVFLAGGDRLVALVWLAGDADHQMAVRAARFDGTGWQTPVTVSPPGPGTQIALTTALLDDGTGLVAWAAFDGHDDEILWSRFDGTGFSEPRPVAADNRVPDITPELFATAGGALLAWSRYDGNDYRVNLARLDGAGWSAPAVIGPRGSTDPGFAELAEPLLLYHHADPSGWGVIALDARGQVRHQTRIDASTPQRPVVRRLGAGVELGWPGGGTAILLWTPPADSP